MEYKKPIYFTVTAPSLDEDRSFISVVSSDGAVVDWCYFSHFEQVSEDSWKLVFIITKPYYYIVGESDVRYGYITGILYGVDYRLCKKINIEDGIKIKQDGCLFEYIGFVSSTETVISQNCNSIEFLNTTDVIYSHCSDEAIAFVSNIHVDIKQECEDVSLLVPDESMIAQYCGELSPIYSGQIQVRQVCDKIEGVSNNLFAIKQPCDFIYDIYNGTLTLEQECSE